MRSRGQPRALRSSIKQTGSVPGNLCPTAVRAVLAQILPQREHPRAPATDYRWHSHQPCPFLLPPPSDPRNVKNMTRTQQGSKQPYSDGFHTMAVDWASDSIACERCGYHTQVFV